MSAVGETIAKFRALQTEPVGINEGTAESHRRFVDELMLPFDLLVDDGLGVASAYGALKPEGGRIDRTVVLVGKDGTILHRQRGAPPPEELLRILADAGDA